MATRLEQSLSKKAKQEGELVPLFEAYHKEFSQAHWDADDIEFLHDLMTRVSDRENHRQDVRVYSPSGIGGCMRHIFLNRHYDELGIPRKFKTKIETHFYFEYGTWTHLKLQLKFYKLHKAGALKLLGTEIPLESKHGDHAGTIDVIYQIDMPTAVDIKGLNQRDFLMVANNDVSFGYQLQLAHYTILANSQRGEFPRIEVAKILAENKGGPIAGYPAALCESDIELSENKFIVKERLAELREHEQTNSIPNIECQTIESRQFKDCPFRDHCKTEVIAYQKKKSRPKNRNTKKNSKLEYLRREGLIAPEEIDSIDDAVPEDFTTLNNRELGAVHSRYAVRYSHAIYVLAQRVTDATTSKRNLHLHEAKFSMRNKDSFKTKYELEAAMERNSTIRELRDAISVLEAEAGMIEAIAKGYETLTKAASREISRRISETAPRD